ncbi:XdhC family protein [Pseudoteredinibacter isoporae]|uniref:Xanthine dehydrogenase accessory factor n=1 Tax=Pseudoteredinibacter isoporae TaxID=570281 RepID=A0A7X0JQW3_9GAMM|nr:XdhC family protein [Pseudoteredinibacter isoporae]MBB6520648.1 xanthine dehydrogenase accessory factor [Pseudoteredinibacter isoporae]NHO86215.1 XdhC family protein [Pseudoteredinibacter isoporae]NIB25334.1 XdhC family protein [Pseudoteredinibacter isoporae]
MQAEHEDILQAALGAAETGRRVCLVSVMETFGSSPRPVGSLLAVADSGEFWGSVSGGCVEEELLERLKQNWPQQADVLLYGESEEERARLQLPCGGCMRLYVQPLQADLLRDAQQALKRRESIALLSTLSDGQCVLQSCDNWQESQWDGERWLNVLSPRWQLYIVGAGPIAQYLVQMAELVNIRCAVIDPRPEYAEQWQEDWAPLFRQYPDDVLSAQGVDRHCFIATVSHDPKIDDLAIMLGLRSDAAYVGAMGSVRTSAKRRQRLQEHFEFSEDELAVLKAPIGLDIHSKTPAEIAVSILADLISVKNA